MVNTVLQPLKRLNLLIIKKRESVNEDCPQPVNRLNQYSWFIEWCRSIEK